MLLHSKDWAQVSSPCLRAQQPQGGVRAQEPGARQQSSTSRCDGAQHSFRNPSELRFPVCCVNVTMASRRVPRVVERIKRRDRRGVDSLLSCAVLRTYRVSGRRFPLRSRRGPAEVSRPTCSEVGPSTDPVYLYHLYLYLYHLCLQLCHLPVHIKLRPHRCLTNDNEPLAPPKINRSGFR